MEAGWGEHHVPRLCLSATGNLQRNEGLELSCSLGFKVISFQLLWVSALQIRAVRVYLFLGSGFCIRLSPTQSHRSGRTRDRFKGVVGISSAGR